VVVSDNGWSTRWRCRCGYDNTGRDVCLMCNGPAPDEVAGAPGLQAAGEASFFKPPPVYGPPVKTGGKANRTVLGFIGANVVLQVAEFAYFVGNDVPRATAIKASMFIGLAFYAVAALWVLGRSASLKLRPTTGLETAAVGAAEGFVVGGVAAVLLVAGLRLATGHPVLDPSTAFLASQGSLGALLLGFVVIVMAAPVVEELVFRGFMAESYRPHGRRLAIILSAAAFSLAHLSVAQLRYYLLMGVVLGVVYWRRGLVGSIATHAAFNGVLLAVAVAAAHGPAVEHRLAGATIEIPGTYRVGTPFEGDDDLVAEGPLGAVVELAHVDVPGPVPPAEDLGQALSRGGLPLPDEIAVRSSTVRVFDLPAGRAVSMEADIDGRDGRVVILPGTGEVWVASYRSDGNVQSSLDFDQMLLSLTLPAA
jgi:membrane protease YdiL (CAAX protease family)